MKKSIKKIEFSKLLCLGAVIIFSIVAIFCIVDYYALVRYSIKADSQIVPDVSLAIAAITSIIATILSYCLYQGMLKSSLNRNKLRINEEGKVEPILEDILEEEE